MTDISQDETSALPPEARTYYVVQRLRVRRRMASTAFIQFVALGAVLIIGGVFLPHWATRIESMATFLGVYFGALATVIMAYWGVGAYEGNKFAGLGGYNGGYRGGNYGEVPNYGGSARPRLSKDPQKAE